MGYKSKHSGSRIDDAVEKVDHCVTIVDVGSILSASEGTQVSFMDLVNPLNKLTFLDSAVPHEVSRSLRISTVVVDEQEVTKYLLCLYYFDRDSVMHEMEISLGDNGIVYKALHTVDFFAKNDGSNFTSDGVSTLINKLAEGTGTPKDADYYVSQYAGGGNVNTGYRRRPLGSLWKWIKGHCDSVYAKAATTLAGYGITDGVKAIDVSFIMHASVGTVIGSTTSDLMDSTCKLYITDGDAVVDVMRYVHVDEEGRKYLCLYYTDVYSKLHEMEIDIADGDVTTALHDVDSFLAKDATAEDSNRLGGKTADQYAETDGSNFTKAGVSALIGKLGTSSVDPVDDNYYIGQAATGSSNFYRKPMSKIWDYIKAKCDSVYLGKTATAADSSKLGGVAASSYARKSTTLGGYGITDGITSIDVTSVLALAVDEAVGSIILTILETNVKLYATQDGAVIDVMRSYHDGYVYLYYHIGGRYAYMAIQKSDGVVKRAFA